MRRTDILASTTSLPARVAKLADARDLKSRVSKETYRFNSGPGHHLTLTAAAILVQPRLHGFAYCLSARDRIMAEIMAVIESGLPRIFATLLLKFLTATF